VEDAVQAAQGLSDNIDAQIEIVMSLMEVSAEAARGAVLKMGQRKETSRFTIAGRDGSPRAVVVERRPSRAAALRPKASVGYRGRI
jgi:hypothetical protein